MSGDITGATTSFALIIPLVFPSGVQLQGFAADDVFDVEPLRSAEAIMGVDGLLSGGFVNVPVEQHITLQADSASMFIFDTWWAVQKFSRTVFRAQAVVSMRAVGTKWALTNGILTQYHPMPNVKKLLQPRKFGITWESVLPAST